MRIVDAATRGIRLAASNDPEAVRRYRVHKRFLTLSKKLGAETRLADMVQDYLGGW